MMMLPCDSVSTLLSGVGSGRGCWYSSVRYRFHSRRLLLLLRLLNMMDKEEIRVGCLYVASCELCLIRVHDLVSKISHRQKVSNK
jgi:hypothetical protein